MSAEVAALRLGTTVAGAAARMWLGGRRREQERHLPVEELARVRVPGVKFSRSVKRQFEQIADAVFDRLEPFLEHEFKALEESGRQTVIDAVCDTLAAADLSDDALLAADAQPAELIRRIARAVPPPVGLGEAESSLYERLFTECVEYYVRIVRSLPVFEERAAAELLVRTSTLGGEVTRILERLPDRSLFAPDGTDQDTAFRRRYLELVSDSLDEVELFRRASDRAAAQVRLSVAYVSMRATGDDNAWRRTARPLPTLRADMSDWEERPGAGGAGMRVEAALRNAARVLLRGEAGSGKTTLLRWLAVTAARGAFAGELAEWNGLTPVFVKLREYSGRTLPTPEAMLDGVAAPLTGIMPRGWVERQLDGGRVLLLIDGVDELLDRERRAVRDWLRRLLATYPDTRVVVTSRPAAAGVDWLRREDFGALHLDRMTPPDLAAFVRQWHQAVRELGDELPCAVEELPQYEQSLLVSLKDRAHLQSLAGTPLLAAMLCAMHLNRGRHLPRDRMELYRSALHTLVHDRDAERNVPSAMDSALGLGDKLILLRDLAWRLSDNNRSEIALDQAAVHVGARLRALRHLDPLDGEQVLRHLRDRSGILRSPAQGRLDFVHRTFQEYLAAEEAAEEDRMGNLVGRAHLDLWRETVVLAAGHANARQREELLGGILDRAEAEPRHARTLRLVAASCQETLPSVPEGLAARLEEAVARLLPARRETDPPALAAVGPRLLRWLPRSGAGLTAKAAARTVETAALVGGEEALDVLEGFTGDTREEVTNALDEAWNYFDAEVYAERVLSRLPLEKCRLTLTHSAQWRAVQGWQTVTDLTVVYPFPRLADLTGLRSLVDLRLYSQRGACDPGELRSLPALRYLALIGYTELRGLEGIGDLEQLRVLSLGVQNVARLDGLRMGPQLSHLTLWDVNGSTDLTRLADWPQLRYVQLMTSETCLPAGLTAVAARPGIRLILHGVDVAAWLADPGFVPPRVRHLDLYDCLLPEDPAALDFPGVRLVVR
ncbi:hypothetical protein RKD32_005249 [Streptomyces sp. SAI-195]|uniref:NACHT domain-containing protein n=1 Tax=unclassified Streptomyces TaxID=2593676 RepID=UPI003443B2D9